MEFSMEYCNWFDMVSWYRWKPQEMLRFFNEEQHRGYEIKKDGVERINRNDGTFKLNYTIANYTVDGAQVWRYDPDGSDNANFSITGFKAHEVVLTDANIFMPYPEADVLQNPYLSMDPEPYDFRDNN